MRQQIPDLVNIHLRPPEIEDRLMPVHHLWPGQRDGEACRDHSEDGDSYLLCRPAWPITGGFQAVGRPLNTNGLLREYLSKGTDLSVYSQEELDEIADSLNTRPRKTLDWRTPLEVYAEVLKKSVAGRARLNNVIH